MKHKITDSEFSNYTGKLGNVFFENGVSENIDDQMNVDTLNAVLGLEPFQDDQILAKE